MSLVTPALSPVVDLSGIVSSGSPVTIVRKDGKSAEGTLEQLDDGRVKVVTGRRGRPFLVDPRDVAEVRQA